MSEEDFEQAKALKLGLEEMRGLAEKVRPACLHEPALRARSMTGRLATLRSAGGALRGGEGALHQG